MRAGLLLPIAAAGLLLSGCMHMHHSRVSHGGAMRTAVSLNAKKPQHCVAGRPCDVTVTLTCATGDACIELSHDVIVIQRGNRADIDFSFNDAPQAKMRIAFEQGSNVRCPGEFLPRVRCDDRNGADGIWKFTVEVESVGKVDPFIVND